MREQAGRIVATRTHLADLLEVHLDADAKGFLIRQNVGTDSVPFSRIQASPDNRNAIRCIFKQVALRDTLWMFS